MDNPDKAGLANLVAMMMNEGTKTKTPEELEDAIGMIGANIRISAGNEDISVDVSCLSKNFEKSLNLVEEMLLEPRWDEEQFPLVKRRIINGLRRNASSPDYLSARTLNNLIFGNTILATEVQGSENTVSSITMDDLKDFYKQNFSPSVATFLVALPQLPFLYQPGSWHQKFGYCCSPVFEGSELSGYLITPAASSGEYRLLESPEP